MFIFFNIKSISSVLFSFDYILLLVNQVTYTGMCVIVSYNYNNNHRNRHIESRKCDIVYQNVYFHKSLIVIAIEEK